MSESLPVRLWRWSMRLHRKKYFRLAKVVKYLNYFLHHALLPAEAVIGDRMKLNHHALGVVIHPSVVIGDDAEIYHQVTIAGEVPLNGDEKVIIGDRVMIGTHAVIVPRGYRGLTIGDDAIIAAGAVVTTDVEARSVVGGVPAKLIRMRSQVEIDAGLSRSACVAKGLLP